MFLKALGFRHSTVLHYGTLTAILLLGLGLRLWQLDTKPLWLDEVLTALFSLGHSYRDVPLDHFFPLSDLDQVFSLKPGVTCEQIARTVATESVHPPLFFCLLYRWMSWLHPTSANWIWALRSLPALIGVGAIAAMYCLNRIAFSAAAGLMAAALMAVSPFAVYLSQEARHYTLPMLLITLALIGLVQMQQDLRSRSLRPVVWLGWVAVNSLGLYVHYFCALALVAQIAALGGWMLWNRQTLPPRYWWTVGLAVAGIGLSYLPWLPTMVSHFSRPETDWLIPYKPDWLDRIAPLYRTLAGWVLMVIALPVEEQPKHIAIPSALLMLIFAVWLTGRIRSGIRQRWQSSADRSPLLLLGGFTLCMILQFLAIVYILDKDITVVPRYNFVYYPGICALLAACLVGTRSESVGERERTDFSSNLPSKLRRTQAIVLIVGLLSSILVVYGFAFQKSYFPDEVASDMHLEPTKPLLVAVSYHSAQEVALGLSFALELRKLYPEAIANSLVRFAFIDQSSGYGQVWHTLARLPQPLPLPLNLWVVASPGMRTKDYPKQLRVTNPSTPNHRPKGICPVDPHEFHRIGFPYQLFRCDLKQ